MPPTPVSPAPVRPSAASLNEAIRRHCAGRTWWSQAALERLGELWEQWNEAVRAEGQGGYGRAA